MKEIKKLLAQHSATLWYMVAILNQKHDQGGQAFPGLIVCHFYSVKMFSNIYGVFGKPGKNSCAGEEVNEHC